MNFSDEIRHKLYFRILMNVISKEIKEHKSNSLQIVHDSGTLFIPSGPTSPHEYFNEYQIRHLYQKRMYEYQDMGFEITMSGVFPQTSYQEVAELAVLAVYNEDTKFLTEELSQTHMMRFLNKELIHTILECSIDNRMSEITILLLEQAYIKRFLNTELIDALLECSIDNQTPEITVLLLEYKRKNNLFKKKNWEL